MFIDEVRVTIRAGKGGNGKVSFFRNRRGPDGGNGGKGGSVYAECDPTMNSLSKYVETNRIHAEDGEPGGSNRRSGIQGKDRILFVPHGTVIIDEDSGGELEIHQGDGKILLCAGGVGGFGNDMFKSATVQTPRYAEPGKLGQKKHLKLVLKLIADVGLIGLPNAGKSSLLNELTHAKARVAPYPFTTLEPNLGSCCGKILADIPGLIEGASMGKGLGSSFLKHIEKVRLLLHCVSVESLKCLKDYETVRTELGTHHHSLLEKKSIVLLTKVDLVSEKKVSELVDEFKDLGIKAFPVSVYDVDRLEEIKRIIEKE